MATVTGKFSEKIDELLGQTVVSAQLDAAGQLTFTLLNGTVKNAGSVSSAVVGASIDVNGHLIFTTRQGAQIDAGPVSGNKPIDSWPIGSVYLGVTSANPSTLLGGGTWVRIAQGRALFGVDTTDTAFDAVEETGGSKTADIAAHHHTMAHIHALTVANNGAIDTTAGAMRPVSSNTQASSAPNTGDAGAATISVLPPYLTLFVWKRTA